MPHIPSQRPNSSGPPAELLAAMAKEHGLPPPGGEAKSKHRNPLALPTIDMNTWDVPLAKVHKHIFGKEPKYHESTGELVPAWRSDQPAGGRQTDGPGTRR